MSYFCFDIILIIQSWFSQYYFFRLCVFSFILFSFFYSHTELHSLQGMEFLEGFGKKKQQPHQQLNNLSSIRINPLSAQSLNIHLHGILFLILIFNPYFYFVQLFHFVSTQLLLSHIVTCYVLSLCG